MSEVCEFSCWCKDVRSNQPPGTHDRACDEVCRLNADVTRLVAELAESVRALAVSRAENETTLRQHGDLCGQIEELRRALAVSQGEVERLRGERDAAAVSARQADAWYRTALKQAERAVAGESNAQDLLETVRAELQNHALLPVLQRRIRALTGPLPATPPETPGDPQEKGTR